MLLPKLEDPDLYLRRHLVRTPRRPAGVIGEPGQADRGIAPQPAVDGLAGDPIPQGHLAERRSVEDFEHGFVPLFH